MMTQHTTRRRTEQASPFPAPRAADRDPTERPGRPFHRSTWSTYTERLMGGSAGPTRPRGGT